MFGSDNKSNSKEYIFILSRLTTSVESLRAGFMSFKNSLSDKGKAYEKAK